MLPFYDYNVRTYQGNLLTQLKPLYTGAERQAQRPEPAGQPGQHDRALLSRAHPVGCGQ